MTLSVTVKVLTLCFLTLVLSDPASVRTGPPRLIVTLPAAFLSVITSLPPLSATDLAVAPLMPRPFVRVVVVHFCLPPLVVHVLLMTIPARENVSPLGRPTDTEDTFAAPLPRVTVKRRPG